MQAREEAQREKARANEEMRRHVTAVLDHSKESRIVSTDGTYPVLLGAIMKAQEIETTALEKAKEMVYVNLAGVNQSVQCGRDWCPGETLQFETCRQSEAS